MINNTVCLIYSYKLPVSNSYESRMQNQSRYYIYQAFSDEGIVTHKLMGKVFEEILDHKLDYLSGFGPFESLNELRKFALRVTEEMGKERALILSLHDFNHIIDESENTDQLKIEFMQRGESIKNTEYQSGSRKILGSFFNTKD